jgi:hypothetical protein
MKNNKLIIGLSVMTIIIITLFLLLKKSEKKKMRAPMITKSANQGKKDSIEKFIDQYTLEIPK